MSDEKYVFSERWPEDYKNAVRKFVTSYRRSAASSLATLTKTHTDFYAAHVEVVRLCDATLAALDEAFAPPR